jgi:hypothetical protein
MDHSTLVLSEFFLTTEWTQEGSMDMQDQQ